jgi:Domain of unknown function (DUF4440)
MLRLLCIFATLLAASNALAQPSQDQNVARLQEEIRNITRQLNEAALKRDRAALERIFAPEFVFVHAYGYIDDRETHIKQTLTRPTDIPYPLPLPSFEAPNQLLVVGDVAVLRRQDGKTDDGARVWATNVFARRDGRFQIIQFHGTELQPERQWLTLPAATLNAYAGRYKGTASGQVYVLTREGDGLRANHILFLKPISETVFFDKAGGEWTFHRTSDGNVTHYTFRNRGREGRADRLD